MNTETENNNSTAPVVEATNETPAPVKAKRKYLRRIVEFPVGREFTPRGLASELSLPVFTINNAVKKHANKLEVVSTRRSPRGRASKVYKMI